MSASVIGRISNPSIDPPLLRKPQAWPARRLRVSLVLPESWPTLMPSPKLPKTAEAQKAEKKITVKAT